MAYIEYSGFYFDSIGLVNSAEFRAVLKAHKSLCLVTTDNAGNEKKYFNEVISPLPEGHDDYVGIIDRDNNDAFMWILYDDCESVTNPSPAFIEVLKIMDAYSIKTLNERLFLSPDGEFNTDDPEILAAEYDFTTGRYAL